MAMGPRAPHHSTSMRCAIVLVFGLNLNFVLSASRRAMKGSRPGRGTACGAEARGGMGWGGGELHHLRASRIRLGRRACREPRHGPRRVLCGSAQAAVSASAAAHASRVVEQWCRLCLRSRM